MINRDQKLEYEARQKARECLAQSSAFQALGQKDQVEVFQQTIDEEYYKLAEAKGLLPREDVFAAEMAHKNDNTRQAGGTMAGLVKSVNFPNFVRDLLKGVFDANLEVSIKQMEQYQELLKEATKSTAAYAKKVATADSYAYLAENDDNFSFGFDDDDSGGEGSPILKDKDGNEVDTEDSKVKAKIMDAQLAIARERRKLLRETIMMGLNRLVVEKGTVRAKVVFDIKSKASTTQTDWDRSNTKRRSAHAWKGQWWSFKYGGRSQHEKTSISISSAASNQSDTVKANLTGEVEINFKSDYFPLDNFADELEGTNEIRKAAASKAKGEET